MYRTYEVLLQYNIEYGILNLCTVCETQNITDVENFKKYALY